MKRVGRDAGARGRTVYYGTNNATADVSSTVTALTVRRKSRPASRVSRPASHVPRLTPRVSRPASHARHDPKLKAIGPAVVPPHVERH